MDKVVGLVVFGAVFTASVAVSSAFNQAIRSLVNEQVKRFFRRNEQ